MHVYIYIYIYVESERERYTHRLTTPDKWPAAIAAMAGTSALVGCRWSWGQSPLPTSWLACFAASNGQEVGLFRLMWLSSRSCSWSQGIAHLKALSEDLLQHLCAILGLCHIHLCILYEDRRSGSKQSPSVLRPDVSYVHVVLGLIAERAAQLK